MEIKTPAERDNLDLLELVCQLHSRSLASGNKEQHDAYVEARNELESRFSPSLQQGGGSVEEIEVYETQDVWDMYAASPDYAKIAYKEFTKRNDWVMVKRASLSSKPSQEATPYTAESLREDANNFTQEEIDAAKATRSDIMQSTVSTLKSIYMAGKICMWDELRNQSPTVETGENKAQLYTCEDMMNVAGWMAAADCNRPIAELKEEAEVYISKIKSATLTTLKAEEGRG